MIRAEIGPQIKGSGRYIATVHEFYALAARCGLDIKLDFDPLEVRTAACTVAGMDNNELFRLSNTINSSGTVVHDVVVSGMRAASAVLDFAQGVPSQAMGLLAGMLGEQQKAQQKVSRSFHECADAMADLMSTVNLCIDFLVDQGAGVLERALVMLPQMPQTLAHIGVATVKAIVTLVGKKMIEAFQLRDQALGQCYDLLYKHCEEALASATEGGIPHYCSEYADDVEKSAAYSQYETAPCSDESVGADESAGSPAGECAPPEPVDECAPPEPADECAPPEPTEPTTSVDDCDNTHQVHPAAVDYSTSTSETSTSEASSAEGSHTQGSSHSVRSDIDTGLVAESVTNDVPPTSPETTSINLGSVADIEATADTESTASTPASVDTQDSHETQDSHDSTTQSDAPAPEPQASSTPQAPESQQPPAAPQAPENQQASSTPEPPAAPQAPERDDLANTGNGITIEKAGEW